jgi:hypothetical protein
MSNDKLAFILTLLLVGAVGMLANIGVDWPPWMPRFGPAIDCTPLIVVMFVIGFFYLQWTRKD